MPKTASWIIRNETDLTKKYYSEEEVDKIIEQCLNAKIHTEDFEKTGIIKCHICAKAFKSIDGIGWTWKPDCNCLKKDLRLGVG